MADTLSTVALFVATPALASILTVTLASRPELRVRSFDSQAALLTYLSLVAADLVILDFDADDPADAVAVCLRAQANAPRAILALASAQSGDLRAATLRAGIDEVLMKPMSPKYLVERVVARTGSRAAVARLFAGPERRRPAAHDWSSHGSNVVPLFSGHSQPNPGLGA